MVVVGDKQYGIYFLMGRRRFPSERSGSGTEKRSRFPGERSGSGTEKRSFDPKEPSLGALGCEQLHERAERHDGNWSQAVHALLHRASCER